MAQLLDGLLADNAVPAQSAGLLGSGWNDPKSAAIMNLAGSMIRGDFGGGLIGANNAYQATQDALLKRADTAQQIGLRNIQLQQAMQQWELMKPILQSVYGQLGGGGAPADGAPSSPAQPEIQPTQGGSLGSGTFGIPIGGQSAVSVPAPGASGAPSGNSGGSVFGLPRSVALTSLALGGPAKFADAVTQYNMPTDFIKSMRAAGIQEGSPQWNSQLQDFLTKQTYTAPTNIRGFGIASPKGLQPLPMNAPQGFMPQQGADGQWSFVPIGNGPQAVQSSATAQAAGKAAVTPVTGYDSTGKPVFTSQLNAATGGAGVGTAPTGNGRYPSAAPGGISPVLSPAAQAAGTEAGKGSGSQLVADNNWANGFATRMFNLNKSLTGLQNANTGPGSEAVNTAKSFLLAQTPAGLGKYLPGVDPNKIASYDEANKYLIQYAIGQAGSLGEGTDSKLATTLAGNANTHISNLAAQDVVRANMALERMKNAQVQQFNQTGLPADQYQKWASKWNTSINPSVFAWDTMLPEARANAAKLMTPAQRAQFTAQYNWALQNHYIDGTQ